MAEKKIILEHVDPVRFYGPYNQGFKKFKQKFPQLNITHRGDVITVKGEDAEIEAFEKILDSTLQYLRKNTKMSLNDLERVIEGAENKAVAGKSEIIVHGQNGKIISARTQNQQFLVNAIEENDMVFALGPAGTGKTYTAVAMAVKSLKNKEVKRIILCRPAVEAGESLGFLPGDMKEKIDPYLRPLYDALQDMLAPEKFKSMMEGGTIEIAPMAFMRGRTLNNCFVILDEAQNATEMQIKMLLTRMGPISKLVVTGDMSQIDLPPRVTSGLKGAVEKLKNIKGIAFVKLTELDVLRHPLVKEIIKAYKQD